MTTRVPIDEIPTPALLIDAARLGRNISRLADYARGRKLNLRPHTKTHKSLRLARMQLDAGAFGLTVAKVGEAEVMSGAGAAVLIAYPTVDAARCGAIAALARECALSVALDSELAAATLSEHARAADSRVGVLIDLDVGLHRTGVQAPAAALELAQRVAELPGLRLDGLFFYPGHIAYNDAAVRELQRVDALLQETLALWRRSGLEARIVSGGSTPTAYLSHHVSAQTEIRPGTYVFNDMNCVAGGFATLDDCAAQIHCTVVSTAVDNQVVLDAGSKALTSDRCGPALDSGHGHVVEYPRAKIVKLNEEHAYVDVSACDKRPALGERVAVIPNHICPCVNLQDRVWMSAGDGHAESLSVDARGKLS